MKSNFTMKLEELKNTVGIKKEDGVPTDTPINEVSTEEVPENFSSEIIDVTDEATAREYGEALARNVFGDQFDQKIFDGVFASALEECGDDWNAVASYLKNCYSGSKNFSNTDKYVVLSDGNVMDGASFKIMTEDSAKDKIKKYEDDAKSHGLTEFRGKPKPKVVFGPDTKDACKEWKSKKNFSKKGITMKNFSKRLFSLEAEIGMEPTPSAIDTTTPAEETSPAPETPAQAEEVVSTEHAESTEAPVEPMNLSEVNKTPACPKCGKDPCECEHLKPIQLDFTDILTEDEVKEISDEAKEFTKYPEQYGNETEQIHAFSAWLESSRYADFCKEALFKAFCK